MGSEMCIRDSETGQGDGEETVTQRNIPTWSAFNSLIASELLPITRVGTPPLIAAPAHEWNTLLTVLDLQKRPRKGLVLTHLLRHTIMLSQLH